MSEQVHPCIFGCPEVFSRSWGLEVSRCDYRYDDMKAMIEKNSDWGFNLDVVISNQCYLPNIFPRVHWEGIKAEPKQTKQPHWAIFKKIHLPSLDKMWKGPSIDMGIELFVQFELCWGKWNLTLLSTRWSVRAGWAESSCCLCWQNVLCIGSKGKKT